MSPTFLQIIILGVVQGLAELLPVSSSAHVIAAERLLGLDPSSPQMAFLLVMLHTGTMGAVIVYFQDSWRRSFSLNPAGARTLVARLAVATAATLVVAEPLKLAIEHLVRHGNRNGEVEDLFSNLPLIAVALAAAGILILVAGLRAARGPVRGAAGVAASGESAAGASAASKAEAPPLRTSVWIGALQGLCLPFRGFSRSGATISAGLLLGMDRRQAEEFSFALAVILTPLVIAYEFHRLVKAGGAGTLHALSGMAVPGLFGFGCSCAAGLLALRWLSGWLEKGRWHYFGIYCLVASAGVALLAVAGL